MESLSSRDFTSSALALDKSFFSVYFLYFFLPYFLIFQHSSGTAHTGFRDLNAHYATQPLQQQELSGFSKVTLDKS